MQKIKICFVVPRAYEYFFQGKKTVGGGAEKQCYLLAKEISYYDDIDIHFCLADFNQKNIQEKDQITFWKIHKLTDNYFNGLRKIIKTLRKIQADIYIFRAANSALLFLSFFIKNILKKKVLYMMASDSEIYFSSLKKKSGILTALFMKLTHQYVDLLSVQNQDQLISLQKQRKHRITELIPNITQPKDFSEAKNNKQEIILWVGRLDTVKQPEIFLELAKKYPDEKFVMIAPDVPEYYKYGQHIREKILKFQNIQYIEYIEADKIIEQYQQSKIYVLTSEKEGFSNTMMEAMTAKCAVLSFNVNPDEIFTNKKNGVCANGSKDLFFQYFDKMLNENEFAESLGINAQKYIFKNHDSKQISSNFVDFIKASF